MFHQHFAAPPVNAEHAAGLSAVAAGDHLYGVLLFQIDAYRLSRLSLCDSHLDYLGSQRDDLHELLVTQFPGHRAEDARADRLAYFIDQDRGVRIEADVGTILPPGLLAHADDHAAHHFAFFNGRIGSGLFHRSGDDIAETGPQPEVAAARQDT